MIIGHNQPYLGMGIRYTRDNKVKGSNLTRIRGGAKNFLTGFRGGEKIFLLVRIKSINNDCMLLADVCTLVQLILEYNIRFRLLPPPCWFITFHPAIL